MSHGDGQAREGGERISILGFALELAYNELKCGESFQTERSEAHYGYGLFATVNILLLIVTSRD